MKAWLARSNECYRLSLTKPQFVAELESYWSGDFVATGMQAEGVHALFRITLEPWTCCRVELSCKPYVRL